MNKASQIFASIFFALVPFVAQSQTEVFNYSGSVDGYLEAALAPPGGLGDFIVTFGTITETLYYNPTANTLRQVGTITISPSTGSFNILPIGVVNPPVLGNATLTLGNNNTVSFDSTATGTGNGSNFYWDFLIPVSGYGTYEGQTFNTNWNVDFLAETQILSNTLTSLDFTDNYYNHVTDETPGGPLIFGVLRDGAGDNTYAEKLDVTAAVATAPDRPPTLLLLSIGLSVLVLFRNATPKAVKSRDSCLCDKL